jgi:hypothetical protein
MNWEERMKRTTLFSAIFAVACGIAPAQRASLQRAWPEIQRLYSKAYTSFVQDGGQEYQMIFDHEGVLLYSSQIGKNDHVETTVPTAILPRLGFIVHTHTKEQAPQPSLVDASTAREFDVPDYVLSRNALYVAMPDRTIRKVGDIVFKKVNHIFLK